MELSFSHPISSLHPIPQEEPIISRKAKRKTSDDKPFEISKKKTCASGKSDPGDCARNS